MGEKQKSSKKSRTSRTSNGVNGGGGRVHNLTDVQLVNLGKGMVQARPTLGGKNR